MIFIIASGLFSVGCLLWILSPNVIQQFKQAVAHLHQNTLFYDRFGKPFNAVDGIQDRRVVPLEQISPKIQYSVLAAEDLRFFQHRGIDVIRMFGALAKNLISQQYIQGGSTLTQQLVKLMLLSPEKTLSRKIKEIGMALILEAHYSKYEILFHYLNTIYLGHGNYGVEQASQAYFHTSAQKISWAQAAFLASIIKKPEIYLKLPPEFNRHSKYFPPSALTEALQRQKRVLFVLYQHQWITPEDYQKALSEKIQLDIPSTPEWTQAPYYSESIVMLLKQKYHLAHISSRDYHIDTTLDPKLQKIAESVIQKWIIDPGLKEEVAFVAIEPSTGYVRVLIGGKDFKKSEFNRATQAKRQPGSIFKTFTYASAFEQGWTPHSTLLDQPLDLTWKDTEGSVIRYNPHNYDRLYGNERDQKGSEGQVYRDAQMTLESAFIRSINTVAVQLLQKIGPPTLAETTSKLNLEIDPSRGLCLALGCQEATLLQLTAAFTPFANGGAFKEPVFITNITDPQDRILYRHHPNPEKKYFPIGRPFK